MRSTGCKYLHNECNKYSMQNHSVATKHHNILIKHHNIPIAIGLKCVKIFLNRLVVLSTGHLNEKQEITFDIFDSQIR